MANVYYQLYLHVIWHIKTDSPRLRKNDMPELYSFLGSQLNKSGCYPIRIGGTDNHIHLLFSLSKSMALESVVAALKRTSSMWLSNRDSYYRMFRWQSGYGAFSVSASKLSTVASYIEGQEEHHRHKSFEEEYKEFLRQYHIDFNEKYISCD